MRQAFANAKRLKAVLAFFCILICCSSLAQQTGPVNLNLEAGKLGQTPTGWIFPAMSAQSGYTASLTDEKPKSGVACAVIRREGAATVQAFGNLMQSFSAAAFRGKRVRFRAAVRAEIPGLGGQAQLWLRVDRRDRQMGFFDNMGDRPIRASAWNYYEIIGDIDQDAEIINFGLMLLGDGKAWLDDVTFETVGDAEQRMIEPARPLTERGLANIIAFSRLLGYVRHFHPSDEAAGAQWEDFAIEGMRRVESAGNPAELANKLQALFSPLAPTVRVFLSGKLQAAMAQLSPPQTGSTIKVVSWQHFGFGTGNAQSAYHSERTFQDAPGGKFPSDLARFQAPFPAELGGGVSCLVPLALYADAEGTWPHNSEAKWDSSAPRPTKVNYSAADRATRLADVALAWNMLQHFYPYFDVVKTDWAAALPAALKSAATDQDESAFLDTLQRMIAALRDGHGRVSGPSLQGAGFVPAIAWEWIEDRLVVTYVRDRDLGLKPGVIVTAIDGRPTPQAIADAESLISGATPQWIRYRALQQLALGKKDAILKLEIEPWATPGKNIEISLKRDTQMGSVREPRPGNIAELEPGIFYVDLTQIQDRDFTDALSKLNEAKSIIFDMRGYPSFQDPMMFFSHLSEKPMTSPQFYIPLITFPDHKDMKFQSVGWQISPSAPYLKARKAFITDGSAISQAETWMGIVENYKLGEIVGGPTAGTNGNINPITLPGRYTIVWTDLKVLKHDGSQHHGIGILPTIPVRRTRAGVAAGRDELLERAVQAVK
jgi:C-terminal processing protease CtpA/Prc